MKNRRRQLGFTMAELLIVVAIIGVLAGVTFVAVQRHQESLNQVELDTVAKEIYVAAQNHLTMAWNENYMGMVKQGDTTDVKIAFYGGTEDAGFDICYVTVTEGSPDGTIYGMMLPPYALDGTVLTNNYLIRYQPKTGLVLDVFYASKTGRFATNLPAYATLMELRGDDKKSGRRSAHIGWYGGTEAASLPTGDPLVEPLLEVKNGDKLIATITDKNSSATDYKLALLLTGKASGAQQVFKLGDTSNSRISNNAPVYEITLDDITTPGMHFAEIDSVNSNEFIPGEDIVLLAVAYNENALSNIAYSDEKTTNSLFEKADNADGEGNTVLPIKAYVNNIRHLENLDAAISDVNYSPSSTKIIAAGGTNPSALAVVAEQTTDIEWPSDFDSASIYCMGTKAGSKTGVGKQGCLLPVNVPGTYKVTTVNVPVTFAYHGTHHSITGIKVDVDAGSAGLFGDLLDGSSVKDLALIDFSVTSATGNAGALAGTLTQKKDTSGNDIPNVSNVVAYNTSTSNDPKDYDATITATGNTNNAKGDAGGLIGKVIGDKAVIEKSAASLVVSSVGSNAGGLIGTMEGGTITGCYSGGHTKGGSYYNGTTAIYNVAASGDAGGLVGDAGATAITNSYSTCSAKGNKAGGLVGNTSGTINKCYSTGLVLGTGTNPVSAAFAVMASSATATDCNYYEIINELATVKRGDSAEEITVKMAEVQDGDLIQSIMYMVPAIKSDGTATADTVVINALDATAESYNEFVGTPEGKAAVGDNPAKPGWKVASPYDLTLADYYKVGGAARFNLKTVSKLGATGVKEKTGPTDTATVEDFVATHYGDWPAPEIFVVNSKKTGS